MKRVHRCGDEFADVMAASEAGQRGAIESWARGVAWNHAPQSANVSQMPTRNDEKKNEVSWEAVDSHHEDAQFELAAWKRARHLPEMKQTQDEIIQTDPTEIEERTSSRSPVERRLCAPETDELDDDEVLRRCDRGALMGCGQAASEP